MALSFAQKEAIIAEVAEVARNAYSAIGAEYRGLTVEQMTALRIDARKAGVYVRVVKNSLAKRAFADTDFACMEAGLAGPLLLAFSQEDPGSAARVAEAFAKVPSSDGSSSLPPMASSLTLNRSCPLAKMPTYDEAVSQLMAVIKAPVQKLAVTINEVPGKLVRTLAAVRDSKSKA